MKNTYLVTSISNWAVNTSLEDALHSIYKNRFSETSTLLLVNNDIVTSFGQFAVEVKDEFKDKYFALKLVVKEKKVPEYLKDVFEEFVDKVRSEGFEFYTYSMHDINQQLIEVYAVSKTDEKFLTSFDATNGDIGDIAFEIQNCDEAAAILDITSKHEEV